MEDNLKNITNENENMKSKIEMNYDSERNMNNLSKEQIIEYSLFRKHHNSRPKHLHGNNSVDLILKYKENIDERNISSSNVMNLSNKNEISKSIFNIHQHLQAKLSKNQRTSVSPIANYHSNASTSNINLNQQIHSAKTSHRRDSLSKREN